MAANYVKCCDFQSIDKIVERPNLYFVYFKLEKLSRFRNLFKNIWLYSASHVFCIR